ncbi:hypothetical protein NKI50_23170 [Mesorhizobium sp. M0563]|uniref:hypothetical protein n=1 Tax=Mesorhizobium sp. M0563 TaxID=2956959 RepID=UPI00333B6966
MTPRQAGWTYRPVFLQGIQAWSAHRALVVSYTRDKGAVMKMIAAADGALAVMSTISLRLRTK